MYIEKEIAGEAMERCGELDQRRGSRRREFRRESTKDEASFESEAATYWERGCLAHFWVIYLLGLAFFDQQVLDCIRLPVDFQQPQHGVKKWKAN